MFSEWLAFLSLHVFALRVPSLLSDCVVFFLILKISFDLVGSPRVCSTHCLWATNVNLIPASGDDEVYHMTMSRVGMRPGGLVCILLFEHGVGPYQIEFSA